MCYCAKPNKYYQNICKILSVKYDRGGTALVIVAFTKKETKQEQQTEQTRNGVSIWQFVRDSYLFCGSCICWVTDSRN